MLPRVQASLAAVIMAGAIVLSVGTPSSVAAAGHPRALVGDFDLWDLTSGASAIIGSPENLRSRVEMAVLQSPTRIPLMTPAQKQHSQMAISAANQIIQGAFQQSVLNANSDVLQALGYLADALFKAKENDTGFATLTPPSKKQPARLVATLPRARVRVFITFVHKRRPAHKPGDIRKLLKGL